MMRDKLKKKETKLYGRFRFKRKNKHTCYELFKFNSLWKWKSLKIMQKQINVFKKNKSIFTCNLEFYHQQRLIIRPTNGAYRTHKILAVLVILSHLFSMFCNLAGVDHCFKCQILSGRLLVLYSKFKIATVTWSVDNANCISCHNDNLLLQNHSCEVNSIEAIGLVNCPSNWKIWKVILLVKQFAKWLTSPLMLKI